MANTLPLSRLRPQIALGLYVGLFALSRIYRIKQVETATEGDPSASHVT
ncbi:hypothetical protein RSSM_04099 [Rhodopirellula sallentina SM41]|uniref:Uncharacterized protein n=1 Tax=Rhodopirellula sallentina SM41 TaxID=1263870 RepID=M5TZP1_9BACT|nr:hypothetical protein RSSM_04099 [Rhodopirellula sallentina SM41]